MGKAARISSDGAHRHEEGTLFLSSLLVARQIGTAVSNKHLSPKTLSEDILKLCFRGVFYRCHQIGSS